MFSHLSSSDNSSIRQDETGNHRGQPDGQTLCTLLVEAESIINPRPLMYQPIYSEEQEPLTPNRFLMFSIRGVNQSNRKLARCNWDLNKQLLDIFWIRWLPTITKRTKWLKDYKPVQIGDPVVVVNDQIQNGWARRRVLRVFPGRDDRICNAEVATASAGWLRYWSSSEISSSGSRRYRCTGPLIQIYEKISIQCLQMIL